MIIGNNPPVAEKLLTPKEIAQYFDIHERTINRLITGCGLPAVRLGGQWRFDIGDVKQWLRRQMINK